MLNLEINNLKKYFGDRLILQIDNLKVYSEDKIGIVGVNGAGKSTLLNILCEKLGGDEGFVKHYGNYSYISQLEEPKDNKLCSKFDLKNKNSNNLSGGEKTIFNNAEFEIFSGAKVALMGDNGCGKTTLIKMILNGEEKIKTSKTLKIGYFSQDLSILDESKTVLYNVMKTSVYNEDFARLILSRLLFKREDVYKDVSVLSGGERVKLSFTKMILTGSNILILDEPTNYLDLYSIEALEDVLKDYDGTVLFVSHDRKFIKKVATDIFIIKNHKINVFRGNYDEYLKFINKPKNVNVDAKNEKMILENKLSEIIGRLSMPEKNDDIEELDAEYKRILQRLREVKQSL